MVDWSKKSHVDFNAGKTQMVLFYWCNNSGAIDVNMYRSVLEKKVSFKILELTFSFKFNWDS